MARELELDERLRKAASYVRPHAVFADVGCDHGRLSVYLMQKCMADRGYACDVRPQPLEKSRSLIEKKGLTEQITTVLTDGLHGMENKGITDVIIAGIGGEVLAHIIEEAPFLQDPKVRIILQPQSREHILRKTLYRLGFSNEEEQVAACGRFVYPIFVSSYCAASKELSDYEAYTGLLPQSSSPLAKEKLLKTANTLLEIAHGMKDSLEKQEESARMEELGKQIKQTAEHMQ